MAGRILSPAVAELLATGLRNRWYAIAPSSFVGADQLRRVTRWGRDWVLFRERAGGPLHMLEDRCPHRGAPLSQGRHIGERIACAYHGVEVDGSGTVALVPGLPGCGLEGRQCVTSLPAHDIAGAIFAYFSDERHPKPVELTPPKYLIDPEYSSFLAYAEWDTPWRFALENGLDPMHGAFLHRQSHSMYAGDTSAKFRIRETEAGFVFEKTRQRGVNFDWSEFAHTGADWVNLEIPYPPSAGPGGPFGIIAMFTPVTELTTAAFFWRYRRVSGWQRDVWRFLYKMVLEERHWAVLEQDRRLLEAMSPDADRAEHLYEHDLGVARIRRLLRRAAQEQADQVRDPGVDASNRQSASLGQGR